MKGPSTKNHLLKKKIDFLVLRIVSPEQIMHEAALSLLSLCLAETVHV